MSYHSARIGPNGATLGAHTKTYESLGVSRLLMLTCLKPHNQAKAAKLTGAVSNCLQKWH